MTEERKRISHMLHMQDRKTLSVTGVLQAGNFDEECITLFVQDGKMVIRGKNLKMGKLSIETGEAELTGLIFSIQYSDAQPRAKGLLAKVLR